MKATDIRDMQFEQIRDRLTGMRQLVWHTFKVHGPCTTAAASALGKIDLLTLRPRAAELLAMGLIELVEIAPSRGNGHEGVYQAVELKALEQQMSRMREPEQLQMF